MNDMTSLLQQIWPPPIELGGEDQRQLAREAACLRGRLAYGGPHMGMVGCDILDICATGARVETFALVDDLPEILTLEFDGVYNRVRRRWTKGRQIGLEFVAEDAIACAWP